MSGKMTETGGELLAIADNLEGFVETSKRDDISNPLNSLNDAIKTVGRSFSGSWLGYHANVYYKDLQAPPPGSHFSEEWGLMDTYGSSFGSSGNWEEYPDEYVKGVIFEFAGNPDLSAACEFNNMASQQFNRRKSDILSILEMEIDGRADAFLDQLKTRAAALDTLEPIDVIERTRPKGPSMTRDTVVIGQGVRIPPHAAVRAEISSIGHTIAVIGELAEIARQAGSHLKRKARIKRKEQMVGTNVFIGHGRSLLWRELKDFIENRLQLPVDEFNRVPVAGITNTARLSEMLDASAVAFLIMTGEDEQPDGRLHARMNVVHEAGLFQGRLGFTRAIVVLEETCEPFSNIEGLGQIRFPKNNIKAAFEEIRQVLEREKIVK